MLAFTRRGSHTSRRHASVWRRTMLHVVRTLLLPALLSVLQPARPAQLLRAQNRSAPRAVDPAADREAVRRAALDYLEGFYEGDSVKFTRAVRPEFYKFGFYYVPDSSRYLTERMSWGEALDYIRRFKARNRPTPASAPKSVAILEVNDVTASAKVTAWWGIDYLLLGKYDGRWMISHVLWQSPPPGA
jgi:hypothetical protein